MAFPYLGYELAVPPRPPTIFTSNCLATIRQSLLARLLARNLGSLLVRKLVAHFPVAHELAQRLPSLQLLPVAALAVAAAVVAAAAVVVAGAAETAPPGVPAAAAAAPPGVPAGAAALPALPAGGCCVVELAVW